MKTKNVFLTLDFLLIIGLTTPVFLQSIQTQRYRPLPDKCDRCGRCTPKEGYIEEVDDYKSDKERPAVLTRDDWPVRPQSGKDTYDDQDVDRGGDKTGGKRTGGYGGGYDNKPPVDDKKSGGGRPGSGYNPILVDRDDGIKPSGGGPGGDYGGGYNPKPVVDRDDELKPSGGGRPGGGYISKPAVNRDDDIKPSGSGRPGTGSDYSGGYKPKPVADRDDDDYKPPGGGRPGGGYNPKPVVVIDEDIKPSGGGRPSDGSGGYGGVYKPKPSDPREDDLKPTRGGRPGGTSGYNVGYNPIPATDRDDDIKPIGRPNDGNGYKGNYKPVVDTGDDRNPTRGRRSSGGGYNPKLVEDYNIKPSGGLINKPGGNRGDHNPKPDEDSYIPEDDRKPSNEDNNDYGKDDKYKEDGKPISVVEGKCNCVPFYRCPDGHIVTDGAGIIDGRKAYETGDKQNTKPSDDKVEPDKCGPYHLCCKTPEGSPAKPSEHRCGVRDASGILSPGSKGEADFGEWPWQAAVLKSEDNIFKCGGVLIDKYHVLTVAHCVFRPKKDFLE